MYIANITKKERKLDKLSIMVRFTDTNLPDGTGSYEKEYFLTGVDTVDVLVRQVDIELTKLNQLSVLDANITIGLVPPPTAKTQAQLDEASFNKDYQKWQRVKKAIDMGILTGSETQVTALLNKVKNAFKPAYLDII